MSRKPIVREVDALDFLTRDHEAIKRLFKDYERLLRRPADDDRKSEIVGKICFALSVHSQIQDEVFYPAVREAINHGSLPRQAVCGNSRCMELIAKLDEMEPGDTDYDHMVGLLGDCVTRQVNEEHEHVFPKVMQSRLDRFALGQKLLQRQKALHEDVTRVGLPRSAAGAPSWPVACRVMMA